jgi:hypothetical protein
MLGAVVLFSSIVPCYRELELHVTLPAESNDWNPEVWSVKTPA